MGEFKVDPLTFISGGERETAIADLQPYFATYTGSWFERLAGNSEPDRFTMNDIVAVSMLGVNVPAPTTIWLLNDGTAETHRLLRAIPVTATIWSSDARSYLEGPALDLWRAVRSGGWPERQGGMGRTKTSKLLAAKRPHLLPVFDQYVGDTLLNHKSDSDWELWRSRFEGGRGDDLRKAVQNIRDEADVPREVSTLRVLDIAIWMRMTTH